MAKHNKIGKIGEELSAKFLKNHKFFVIEMNYWKKWGEIDVVAKKDGLTHFVEVKTVSRNLSEDVPHETDGYRPEDNIHPGKLKRLSRTIQSYLLEKGIDDDWQFDVITVFLDMENKKAKIKHLKDVIL
jgi:putative endonuclease